MYGVLRDLHEPQHRTVSIPKCQPSRGLEYGHPYAVIPALRSDLYCVVLSSHYNLKLRERLVSHHQLDQENLSQMGHFVTWSPPGSSLHVDWSTFLVISSALVCLPLLFLLRRRWSRYSKLPPGPPGYPFIGNVLQLAKAKRPHLLFFDWSKTYGKSSFRCCEPLSEILRRKYFAFFRVRQQHDGCEQILSCDWPSWETRGNLFGPPKHGSRNWNVNNHCIFTPPAWPLSYETRLGWDAAMPAMR